MEDSASRRKRSRGRPTSARQAVRVDITLTLFPGEDDDLLGWFAALATGQRAMQVKAALRQGGVRLPSAVEDEEDDLIDDDAFAAMLGAL